MTFALGSAFLPAPSGTGGAGSGVNSVSGGDGITVSGTAADPVVAWDDPIAHRPTFNSGAATSPFQIAGSSVDVLVVGLNADKLDGIDSSGFALAVHTHAASAITSGQVALARGGSGADMSATGGTGHVVKQASAGATFTTGQVAEADIADAAVAYAKIQNVADQRVLGNDSGGAAAPSELTVPEVLAIIDDAQGSLLWRGAAAWEALTDPGGGTKFLFISSSTIAWSALTESDLPALSTSKITSGTFADARISEASVTQHQAAMLTLAENVPIKLDETLSADGKFTGFTIEGTAGVALAFGDLVYLAVADSRWELADASAASTAGTVLLGICVLAAGADGNATRVLLRGTVRADTAFPTLTVGAAAYVSETAGDITNTAPTTTDAVIRVIGFGVDANTMNFDPSPDYGTHV